MADVTLKLKADNTQYVQKVQQAQKESQKLFDTAEKGLKREKGLIEDVEGAIEELTQRKKKAWTVEDIEKYNQKIAEAKQTLKEYETAGVQSNEKIVKSGSGVKAIYIGIAAAVGAVAGAFKILKDAVLETEVGLNRFNVIGAVTKQLMYDIIHRTDWKSWIQNMKDVAGITQKLNDLRAEERYQLVQSKAHQIAYNKFLTDAKDQTKDLTERIKSYDLALLAHNKMLDIENSVTQKRLDLVRELLIESPGTERLLEEEGSLILKLMDIENRRWASERDSINEIRVAQI